MNIEKYIIENSGCEDKILAELVRETNLTKLMPRMLSGHIQGKLLEQLSKIISPQNILEIGTFTGYSAICLSKGLKKGGFIHTIEINDENEPIISKYFEKAGINSFAKLYIGNALDIINDLDIEFDLVFIDGDKREYPQYYKAVLPKVKIGGYILGDNVLWDNKVIDKPDTFDAYTRGIVEFNSMVNSDSNVENFILPVRDGLMVIRKIS